MPFRIIPTGNGFIMQDTATGEYAPGANCQGDAFMTAANDHAIMMNGGGLDGFTASFGKLMNLIKTQAKPRKRKPMPPLSAQDSYDLINTVNAMVKRIKKMMDYVESEEELEEIIKAARMGEVYGLTETEQEILGKHSKAFEDYWNKQNPYVIPGEINTLPPHNPPNPWVELGLGFVGAPYFWSKPDLDEESTVMRVARERVSESDERFTGLDRKTFYKKLSKLQKTWDKAEAEAQERQHAHG